MLCIYIIRTFTVPNLKVSCILLSALICYDIFWVYLSPYLIELLSPNSGGESTETSGLRMLHESTDPNDSVMVSVAESTQGGAALPISLILPAGQGAERLLGLGDIIVPGINV